MPNFIPKIIPLKFLLPIFFQVSAIIVPFLYLHFALRQGQEKALDGEVLLSFLGFAAIAIDYSASTFIARLQARLLRAGGYATILVGRLVVALLTLSLCALISVGVGSTLSVINIAAFCAGFLAIALDPSWIFIGRGNLWTPAALTTLRFAIATALTSEGFPPILGIGLGFLLGSVIFMIHGFRWIRLTPVVRPRLFLGILKRLFLPTTTDLTTALFSRLDVAVASILLPVDQALMYTICRKLILGLQSVTFSSVRVLYIEKNKARRTENEAALLRLSLLSTAASPPLCSIAIYYFMDFSFTPTLILVIIILSSLIMIGYFKNILQFAILYRNGLFLYDFLATQVAAISFGLMTLTLYVAHQQSAIIFAIIRVTTEIVYLATARIWTPIRQSAGNGTQ